MNADYQQHQPQFLRPGASSPHISPSITPNPDQQEMSRKAVPYRPVSNGTPQAPYQSSQAPVQNYSSRFPSAHFTHDDVDMGNQNSHPPLPQAPFAAESHSRSRSSTLQNSPQRQSNPGLAPSAYPARPPSNSMSGNTPPAKQPVSPTMYHQTLYSRPTSSSATASNPRLVKHNSGPQLTPSQSYLNGSSQPNPSAQSSQTHPQSQFTAPITVGELFPPISCH